MSARKARSLRRARRKRPEIVGGEEIPGRHAPARRLPLEQLLGRLADPARRLVEDPGEREAVARVAQQAQVGDEVLDLGPLVETHPADERVGDLLLEELVLEGAGLGVGAHQHGEIGEAVLGGESAQRAGHPAGLVPLVGGAVEGDPGAGSGVGPEPLAAAVPVLRDDRVGGREDRGGGAVVALQLAHRGAGEVPFEVEDVVEIGAAPPVDPLVLVAHRGEVAARGHERGDQPQLGVVRVLELVDQQVLGAAPHPGGDLRVRVEEPDREREHVVEVDAGGGREQRLVAVVDAGDPLRVEVARLPFVRLGADEPVLRAADRREHRARRERGLGEPLGQERLPDELLLVVGVEDREVARETEPLPVPAQEAEREAVEGAEEDRQREAAEERLGALPHFARRLVREGHGGDRVGSHAALRDQPGDAVGDHPRLARTGAREHQLRPLAVGHGGELLLVQLTGEVDGGAAAHGRSLPDGVGGSNHVGRGKEVGAPGR